MPVLDWTRTDLEYVLPMVPKRCVLTRLNRRVRTAHPEASGSRKPTMMAEEIAQAERRFATMSEEDKAVWTRNILPVYPGAEEVGYTLDQFRVNTATYIKIHDKAKLREHFAYFPKSHYSGCRRRLARMAVHPPRPILGLPRIISTIEDMYGWCGNCWPAWRTASPCTGSYGVRADNDLVDKDSLNLVRASTLRICAYAARRELKHLPRGRPFASMAMWI